MIAFAVGACVLISLTVYAVKRLDAAEDRLVEVSHEPMEGEA